MLLGLGVGGNDRLLAHPVVEPELGMLAGGGGKANEELVGFQLMDEVEPALQRVLGALDVRARVLVAPLREQGRPPPRQ
jgi:hypothetical protein